MANTNDTIQGDRNIIAYDTDVKLLVPSDTYDLDPNIVDSSYLNGTAILNGTATMPVHETDPLPIYGQSSALRFTKASNNSFRFYDFSNYPPDVSGNFTHKFLVKFDFDGGADNVILHGLPSGSSLQKYFSVNRESDNRLRLGIYNTVSPYSTYLYSTTTIPVDTWTYVEITRVSGTYYMLINGLLEAQYTEVPMQVLSNSYAIILYGDVATNRGYLDGWMKEMQYQTIGGHTESYTIPDTPSTSYVDHNIVNYDTVPSLPEVQVLQEEEPNMMTMTRTASGDDISVGECISLADNGTVFPCGKLPDTLSDAITGIAPSNIITNGSTVYDPDTERLILVWRDATDTSGTCVTSTISGGTVVTGVQNKFVTTDPDKVHICYDSINEKIIITHGYYISGAMNLYAIVGDIIPHATDPTQDSISFGTGQLIVDNITSGYASICPVYDPINEVLVLCCTGDLSGGHVYLCTLDGTAINVNDSIQYDSDTSLEVIHTEYNTTENKIVIAYGGTYKITCVAGTITTTGAPSAATISFGTLQIASSNVNLHSVAPGLAVLPDGTFIVSYVDQSDNRLARIGTIDESNNISFGSEIDYNSTGYYTNTITKYDSANDAIVDTNVILNGYPKITVGRVADGDMDVWYTSEIPTLTYYNILLGYHEGEEKFIIAYCTANYDIIFRVYDVNTHLMTSSNILGIAQTSGVIGEDCIVGRYGFLDETQTGLTPNRQYYVDVWGALTTTDTGYYVGYSISSTQLIIKA